MGHRELIASLYQEGEKKIHELWRNKEADLARIRAEMDKRIESFREECRIHHAGAVAVQAKEIFSKAADQGRDVRLRSEHALAERLYARSLALLRELRKSDYARVFRALVSELPPLAWKTVKVNPEDRGLAGQYFPDARIVADRGISGGLEVATEEESVLIINTFEKRLERAWDTLLPDIIKSL